MVPSNILNRVFLIKLGKSQGTAFTIEVKARQYLVTAKHVVASIKSDMTIEVYHNDSWQQLSIERIWYAAAPRDLAVLFLRESISLRYDVITTEQPFLSQDIYFLGFPYGHFTNSNKTNNGFPIPFVKKGIIAGFADVKLHTDMIVLDAINNPGFSGGPVFSIGPNNIPNIFGVINSYEWKTETVFHGDLPTSLTTHANTGLVNCTNIITAIQYLNLI
jgi:S1-C subfamily serine protease